MIPRWQCKRCLLVATANTGKICTACLNSNTSGPKVKLYAVQPRPYTRKPILADELVISDEELARLHQVRLEKEAKKEAKKNRQFLPKRGINTIRKFRGHVLPKSVES